MTLHLITSLGRKHEIIDMESKCSKRPIFLFFLKIYDCDPPRRVSVLASSVSSSFCPLQYMHQISYDPILVIHKKADAKLYTCAMTGFSDVAPLRPHSTTCNPTQKFIRQFLPHSWCRIQRHVGAIQKVLLHWIPAMCNLTILEDQGLHQCFLVDHSYENQEDVLDRHSHD